MRKLVWSLGLVLVLMCWGIGSYDLGISPAHGQPPYYPPGYQYCDPYNYCTYYSAPYEDPASQFFFYTVPQIGGELLEEHREHERHEGFERHERQEHGGFGGQRR